MKNTTFLYVIGRNTYPKLWKGLLKRRDFIKDSKYFQINNGTIIDVWTHPQITGLPTLRPTPNPNNPINEIDIKVAELTLEEPKRWNILLLQALFNTDFVNIILKIPLSSFNYFSIPDKVTWLHHSTGNFSVKLAYDTMIKIQISPQMQEINVTFKKLWKLKSQYRLKHVLWKVMHQILPTREPF